ncbi:MAG: transposase [Bacteroidia bacterium]|nr:transposase [Bacteroidia bacterium]
MRILFKKFLENPLKTKIKPSDKCYLVIDGTHIKNNFCVLNYLDSGLKYLQYYRTVERENYYDYTTDLEFLKQIGIIPFSITSDGQRGLLKAVRDVFPSVVHQRCIIHIQRMSLIYLTRNPKTGAGITLRYWVKKLHKIDNHDKRDYWIRQFDGWCRKYSSFLKEKSESLSGRKWYTHKLLRRTRSLIKNALPNMFHYLDNPHIPKSTNCLETRFSYLKNNLKIHRGLSKKSRQNFILWYNYFKYNK